MTSGAYSILSPELDPTGSYFVEASAGTGKTFAIEHLVTRLILSDEPITTIDRILVVTFTRAATRELRQRIRSTLQRTLHLIEGVGEGEIPPYLAPILQLDVDQRQKVRWRLGDALDGFDGAAIYTIHRFCYEMLTNCALLGDDALWLGASDGGLSYDDRLAVARDYLRVGLRSEEVSPGQLERVLRLANGSEERLLRLLVREVAQTEGAIGPDFSTLHQAFNDCLARRRPEAAKVLVDFERIAPCFVGLANREGVVKEVVWESVSALARLLELGRGTPQEFDQLLEMPIALLDLVARGRTKRGKELPNDLYYPTLYEWLDGELGPLVDEARSSEAVLQRMAHGYRAFLDQILSQRETFSYASLLELMANQCASDSFVEAVRGRFDGAIIDEFQDTDGLQWEIFNRLFVGRKQPLVLVGDPKQSIYAFRSADLYSYLAAGEAMGRESHRTLGTNYRSRPKLVAALNALLGRMSCSGFLPLPKLGSQLECVEVAAGREEDNALSSNGAIHFLLFEGRTMRLGGNFPSQTVEEEVLFPTIVSEIQTLCEGGTAFGGIAVLVRDRYQGERFSQYAVSHGLPVAVARGRRPGDSGGLELLYHLVRAVIDPSEWSLVRLALACRLVGWSLTDVSNLLKGDGVIEVSTWFWELRSILDREGFLALFEAILDHCWGGEITAAERLLGEEGGPPLLADLYQLASMVSEREAIERVSPDRIPALLHELRIAAEENEEVPRIFPPGDEEAIQLLTPYAAKGLEYDVVFGLSLASRTKAGDGSSVAELDAEKERLLYVALTRARDRLYIPVGVDLSGKAIVAGTAAPAELLMGRLGAELPITNRSACRTLLEPLVPNGITIVEIEATKAPVVEVRSTASLVAPRAPLITRSRRVLQSFSRLAQPQYRPHEGLTPPHDPFAPVKSRHTLPAGAATGLLLHQILEETPWGVEGVESQVAKTLKGHPLAAWEGVVSGMVQDGFTTLIDGFPLLAVDGDCKRRELEFLYGVSGSEGLGDQVVAGGMAGVMDLFFAHQGRYYLLDWKSNWLGPDESFYSQEALLEEMERHDYILQARLYTEALRRYLSLFDLGPFEEIFGGVVYLFLRGGDPLHLSLKEIGL